MENGLLSLCLPDTIDLHHWLLKYRGGRHHVGSIRWSTWRKNVDCPRTRDDAHQLPVWDLNGHSGYGHNRPKAAHKPFSASPYCMPQSNNYMRLPTEGDRSRSRRHDILGGGLDADYQIISKWPRGVAAVNFMLNLLLAMNTIISLQALPSMKW
jgi:hypothetical protein